VKNHDLVNVAGGYVVRVCDGNGAVLSHSVVIPRWRDAFTQGKSDAAGRPFTDRTGGKLLG